MLNHYDILMITGPIVTGPIVTGHCHILMPNQRDTSLIIAIVLLLLHNHRTTLLFHLFIFE